jgi:glutamine synthetase
MEDIISVDSYKSEVRLLQVVTSNIEALDGQLSELAEKIEKAEKLDSLPKKAKYFSDHIAPALEDARRPADVLENMLPDSDWPLPKYSEMLFIM